MKLQTSRRRRRSFTAVAAVALLVALMPASAALADHAGADTTTLDVTPGFVPGNPQCGLFEPNEIYFGSPSGFQELTDTFDIPEEDGGGTFTATVSIQTRPGNTFDFYSDTQVTLVIVKGGPNANSYDYEPSAYGDNSTPAGWTDTALHAPVNHKNGNYYGLSHISFCFEPNPVIIPESNISGVKWWDADADGILDAPGEMLLEGWTINIYDDDTNDLLDTQATDADGAWSSGPYQEGTNLRVCEEQQTGWRQTYPLDGDDPACHLLTVEATDTENLNFGNIPSLDAEKTADASFTRTWVWDIVKDGDISEHTFGFGDTDPITVNYDVTVSAVATDSDFTVSGDVVVTNNTAHDATIAGIDDELEIDGGGTLPATVTCPEAFPFSLLAGDDVTCTYSVTDASLEGTTGTNSATVDATGFEVDVATDGWDFAGATMDDEIDECIDVDDDLYGALGTVCAGDLDANGEYLFEYTLDIDPADVVAEVGCGEAYNFTNTAAFVTNDTATEGDDDHTVVVVVECETTEGCTPGYWKTHPSAWENYSPGQTVDSVFTGAGSYDDSTLMEALNFGGGNGVDGARQILLRAGVAALLNAGHPGVGYELDEAQVIAAVDAALDGNRGAMLSTASYLDGLNNAGCPL